MQYDRLTLALSLVSNNRTVLLHVREDAQPTIWCSTLEYITIHLYSSRQVKNKTQKASDTTYLLPLMSISMRKTSFWSLLYCCWLVIFSSISWKSILYTSFTSCCQVTWTVSWGMDNCFSCPSWLSSAIFRMPFCTINRVWSSSLFLLANKAISLFHGEKVEASQVKDVLFECAPRAALPLQPVQDASPLPLSLVRPKKQWFPWLFPGGFHLLFLFLCLSWSKKCQSRTALAKSPQMPSLLKSWPFQIDQEILSLRLPGTF